MPPAPNVSPGMYVAPPQTGAVAGETRSVGVNGLRITFPELSIGLPSLELPFLTRYKRAARMHVDSGIAPYVTNPYYAQAMAMHQAQIRAIQQQRSSEDEQGRGTEARSARSRDADCQRKLEQLEEDYQQMEEKLKRFKQLEDCIRQYQSALQEFQSQSRIAQGNSNAVSPYNRSGVEPSRLPFSHQSNQGAVVGPPVPPTKNEYSIRKLSHTQPLRSYEPATHYVAPVLRLPNTE